MRKGLAALIRPRQFDWATLAWCAVLVVCPVVCATMTSILDLVTRGRTIELRQFLQIELAAIGFVVGSLIPFAGWMVFGESDFRRRLILVFICLSSLFAAVAFGMRCVGPDEWYWRTTCGALMMAALVLASVLVAGFLRFTWYCSSSRDGPKRPIRHPSGNVRVGVGVVIFVAIASWLLRRRIGDEMISSQMIALLLVYGVVPLIILAAPLKRLSKWFLILAVYAGLGLIVWIFYTPDFADASVAFAAHIGFSAGILLGSSGWLLFFKRLASAESIKSVGQPALSAGIHRPLGPSPIIAISSLIGLSVVFNFFATYNIRYIFDEGWPIQAETIAIARLYNGWQNVPDTSDGSIRFLGIDWEFSLANQRLDAGDLAAIKQLAPVSTLAFRNEGHQYKEVFEALATEPVTRLEVHDVRIDAEFVAAIAKLKSLREVALIGVEISEEDLDALPQVPFLIILDLSRSTISAATIQRVAELPLLQSLDLSGTNVTVEMLEPLVAVASLRELRLANTKIGDELALFVARSKQLSTIDISQTRVRWPALAELSREFNVVKTDAPIAAVSKLYFQSGIKLWTVGLETNQRSGDTNDQIMALINPQARQENWIVEFAQAVEKDADGNIVGLDMTDVFLCLDDVRTLAKLPKLKRLAISPEAIILRPTIDRVSNVHSVDTSDLEKFHNLEHLRISMKRRYGGNYLDRVQVFQSLLKNTSVHELEINWADPFWITWDIEFFDAIKQAGRVKRLTLRDVTDGNSIVKNWMVDVPTLEQVIVVVQKQNDFAWGDWLREVFPNSKTAFRIEAEDAWPRFLPSEFYDIE